MQFQRKHRNRSKAYPLASGNIKTGLVGTGTRVLIVAHEGEHSYRLEMTYDEAADLAQMLLTMVDIDERFDIPQED